MFFKIIQQMRLDTFFKDFGNVTNNRNRTVISTVRTRTLTFINWGHSCSFAVNRN